MLRNLQGQGDPKMNDIVLKLVYALKVEVGIYFFMCVLDLEFHNQFVEKRISHPFTIFYALRTGGTIFKTDLQIFLSLILRFVSSQVSFVFKA